MCITCKRGERVRQFDIFGTPAGVTYDAEPVYKTGLGGGITLFILIYFFSNFFLSLAQVVLHRQYKLSKTDQYNLYNVESDPWVLETKNQALFGALDIDDDQGFELPEGYIIQDFFRIQFYKRYRDENNN